MFIFQGLGRKLESRPSSAAATPLPPLNLSRNSSSASIQLKSPTRPISAPFDQDHQSPIKQQNRKSLYQNKPKPKQTSLNKSQAPAKSGLTGLNSRSGSFNRSQDSILSPRKKPTVVPPSRKEVKKPVKQNREACFLKVGSQSMSSRSRIAFVIFRSMELESRHSCWNLSPMTRSKLSGVF